MSNTKLVALVFDEEEQKALMTGPGGPMVRLQSRPEIALAVLKTIEQKAEEAGVELEDLVVVYKADNGQVKIKQT